MRDLSGGLPTTSRPLFRADNHIILGYVTLIGQEFLHIFLGSKNP
jgi:hypothetical protein